MNTTTSQSNFSASHYRVSCVNCAKAHRTCNRKLPSCERCMTKGLHCQYTPPKKRKRAFYQDVEEDEEDNSNKIVRVHGGCSVRTVLDLLFMDHIGQRNVVLSTNTSLPPMVPMMTSFGADYEKKVEKVQWYNEKALLLFHSPVKKSEQVSNGDLVSSDDLRESYFKLSQTNNLRRMNIKDLQILTENYSRSEVLDASEYLFSISKQKLLEPDLFARIATDHKLAGACLGSAMYIVGKNGNLNEAKLFLNLIKVFIDNTKKILDLDMSLFSGIQKEDMVELQNFTKAIHAGHIAVETLIHQEELLNSRGNDRLEALIQMVEKYAQFHSIMPELKVFSSILRQPADRLEKFCRLSDLIAEDTRFCAEQEQNIDFVLAMRRIAFKLLKFLGIHVEEDLPDPSKNKSELYAMKQEAAHEVIQSVHANMQIFLLFGSFNYKCLILICDTLIHGAKFETVATSLYLTSMQKATVIMEALNEKYVDNRLASTSKLLQSQIIKLAESIQAVPQQQLLQENQLHNLEANLQSPSSTLPSDLSFDTAEWILQSPTDDPLDIFLTTDDLV